MSMVADYGWFGCGCTTVVIPERHIQMLPQEKTNFK